MNFMIKGFEIVAPRVGILRSLDFDADHLGLIAKSQMVEKVYVVSELLEEPYYYEYPQPIKVLKQVAATLEELEDSYPVEDKAVALNFLLYYEGEDLEDIRVGHVEDLQVFENECDEDIAKILVSHRLDDDLEPYFDYDSYADNQYCTGDWVRFEYQGKEYKIVKED